MGNVHRFDRAPSLVITPESCLSKWRSFGASVGLSVLFIVVYGTTNWLASRRMHVSTFVYGWERGIPFVPVFVPPYLSLDCFFVAAPFLCRTRRELGVLAARISAAILVAGCCFVLIPLRYADPPHEISGWLGQVFAQFLKIDRPYNLLPSLHAALGLILFDFYFHRTRGASRVFICVWFGLIALSPLLTHQHHVADIVCGAALAGYCIYAFRFEREVAHPVTPNVRIGLLYLAGAACSLAVCLLDPKSCGLLGWIGISLSLAATAYFGAGPGTFRKRSDGSIPSASWFALGPCILGQFCSLHYYRHKIPLRAAITSSVSIGRRPNNREARVLRRSGVIAVLDLSAELPESRILRRLRYCSIPVLDLTAPTSQQLGLMAQFIGAAVADGQVYVHCKIGYSRSAAAVAAYLLSRGDAQTVGEAMAIVRRARPEVLFSGATLQALETFLVDLKSPLRRDAFLLASPVPCGT